MDIDVTALTDGELVALVAQVEAERARRAVLLQSADAAVALSRSYWAAREELLAEGEHVDWVQPTGAHDAYLKSQVVNHLGKAYKSNMGGNVWEPGTNGTWAEVVMGGGNPAWVQPQGTVGMYQPPQRVTHKGKTWECSTPNCVWEPGVYGWVEVTTPTRAARANQT